MDGGKVNPGRYDPKVAIIGCGISGLAAAKELARFNPVVFEATDSIGGVWKHCSYHSTKLQTPRMDYEFSDYQWKDRKNSSFPSHIEILDYLDGYATHFDLWKFIRFQNKVVEIKHLLLNDDVNHSDQYWRRPIGQPIWKIGVEDSSSGGVKWQEFEFVVMCIGKYGDIANIPVFPPEKGPGVFNGKVMHSMDYCKLKKEETVELLKGKKVVVVGYKKSAIDLALECAQANAGEEGEPCTMIVRSLHWIVPSYSIWGLPFFLFFSTRFSQFLYERPNQGFLRSVICNLSDPLRKFVSKFIESYLTWKLPLRKYGLKPDHPFLEDYASCQMAILPDTFFDEADRGMIRFERPASPDWCFWEGGVLLDDGSTKLEADLVLLATGYDGKAKLKLVLPEPYRGLIDDPSGVLPLYRGMIHPEIPHMAFVGYIESVSNLHTSELRCKWLSRLLDEQIELPSVKTMLERTKEETEIMRRTTRFYKRHCISTYSINHSDEMCEEMGWGSWRKKGWLSEAFSPYNNQDYIEKQPED